MISERPLREIIHPSDILGLAPGFNKAFVAAELFLLRGPRGGSPQPLSSEQGLKAFSAKYSLKCSGPIRISEEEADTLA